MLYMLFHAHVWFSTGKINIKLAYTYRGRTNIYFLKWGRRTKKFEKPWYNLSCCCRSSFFVLFHSFFVKTSLSTNKASFKKYFRN